MVNNNFNQSNDYQSKINAFYENEDRNQLEQLRQKYLTVPNYKNMSLRDELQTRFDLNKMNNLKRKFSNNQLEQKTFIQQGTGTAMELDHYVKNYKIPKWPEYFGTMAPYIDFARNYIDMYTKNLDFSDKFFHCKANYESSSRGVDSINSAIFLGRLRETIDMLKGNNSSDALADLKANIRGRLGFQHGKTLAESCPTHYKDYESW